MNDIELQALVALVQHEAALFSLQCAQYGEQQHAPDAEVLSALQNELMQRGILPFPARPTPDGEKGTPR